MGEGEEAEQVHDEVDDGGHRHLQGAPDEVRVLGEGRARRHVARRVGGADVHRREQKLGRLTHEEGRGGTVLLLQVAAAVPPHLARVRVGISARFIALGSRGCTAAPVRSRRSEGSLRTGWPA